MVSGAAAATATITATGAAVAGANAMRHAHSSSLPQWAQWVYFGLFVFGVVLLCCAIFIFGRAIYEWDIYPWLQNRKEIKKMIAVQKRNK